MKVCKFGLVLLLLFMSIGWPALAAPEHAESVELALADMRQRLNLSEDQQAQIEPIVRDHVEASQAVLRAHGISSTGASSGGPKSLRQLRALANDMKPVRDQTRRRLAEVLSPEQMAEYQLIEEERRQAMRERLKNSR